MSLLHDLLILIVFVGPVAMVAYMLREKLGLSQQPSREFTPQRRGEIRPPPVFAVLVWVVALVALIFLPWKDR